MPLPREGTTNLVKYLTKALHAMRNNNKPGVRGGDTGDRWEVGGGEGGERGRGEGRHQRGGERQQGGDFPSERHYKNHSTF